MALYDIIAQISQEQCDKLYQTKISIGNLSVDEHKLTINDLIFDFEDVIFSETAVDKMRYGDFTAVCIQTQNCIFILDKLGVIL